MSVLDERSRVLLLILIASCVSLVSVGVAVYLMHQTTMAETRTRLADTARAQARMIGAVAHFDAIESADYPGGTLAATLSQIRDAHDNLNISGETGEFTLAHRRADDIEFLLSLRHEDQEPEERARVPWSSHLAEPMRRALEGSSGVVVGPDYRGETVLAAHEPIPELDMGIVAKIDLREVRQPVVHAACLAGGIALVLVVAGAWLFHVVTNPLLVRLERTAQQTAHANALLQAVLEASIDGILAVDGEGAVMAHTARFLAMWGIPEERVTTIGGEPLFRELMTKISDPDRISRIHRSLVARPFERRDIEIECTDGRIISMHAAPIHGLGGTLLGRVLYFRDKTQSLRAKQEIRDRTQELQALNEALVGREARMIELKELVNSLTAELGREPPYPPIWNEEPGDEPAHG